MPPITRRAAYDFSGSVALVTGAAGDIGRAAAVRLASCGAALALADLEAARCRLEETAGLCGEHVGTRAVRVVPVDVTDPTLVEGAFDAAAGDLGVPDLVFNNAGVQGAFAPTVDYPLDDVREVLAVNVAGVINVLRTAARRLREAGRGGAVVNTASRAGVGGAPNMLAYSASKAAVVGLTKTAALDLAPLGIRVNAVSPAFIGPGEMWDRQVRHQARTPSPYYPAEPDGVAEAMLDAVPMRRLGSVEEVAATVCWLLSEEASYVTGENLLVTGGIVG